MNSLKEIYENVIANVNKYYLVKNNLSGSIQQQIDLSSFVTKAINGENYGTQITSINIEGITGDIIDSSIKNRKEVKDNNGNTTYTINIPVHLWFISSLTSSKAWMSLTNFDGSYESEKPAFIICILTHHMYESSHKISLNQLADSIIAPEYFLRVFSYKEFSVDIFNHIYQPEFLIIRNMKTINDLLEHYMINLSSVASIYISDPVNKRLLGLPSFSKKIITKVNGTTSKYTFNKEYPDMYKIIQPSNVTYRKVVYSKEKNPFAV